MANQVNVTFTASVLNGALNDNFPQVNDLFAQTTQGKFSSSPTIAITDTTLAITLANPGLVALKNLDETNFISWGPDSAGTRVPLGKLLPGRTSHIYLESASVVLKAIADTAPCKLEIWAIEE